MAALGAALPDLDVIDHAYDEDEEDDLHPDTTDLVDDTGKKRRGPDIAWTKVATFKDS